MDKIGSKMKSEEEILNSCWNDYGDFFSYVINKYPPDCIVLNLAAMGARLMLGMGFSKLQIMKYIGDAVDETIEVMEKDDRD